MKDDNVYGLVFGGGGARGAYQLGVWRAIRKMGIRVGAVAGASIGSMNGALFAQGDLNLAQKAWRNLNLSEVIRLEDELPSPDNLFDIRNINQLIKHVLIQKGIDMEPVRDILARYIDEDKIRASAIDFGMITYDISGMAPTEVFISDIPEGCLFDYIMASSCFPVFKSIEIDGRKFIDGGLYNNIPTDMLAKKGYDHLILVDIGGVEIIRSPRCKDVDIVTIKPQTGLGGLFDMTPSVLRRNIKRGEFDTYRAFGKLTGNLFYLTVKSTARFVRQYGQDALDGLEIAAQKYGVDPYHIYNPDKLLKIVTEKFEADRTNYKLLRSRAHAELRKNLQGERPLIWKFDQEFLIPAAVDLMADPAKSDHAKKTFRRIAPAPAKAADALLTLGIRPTFYESEMSGSLAEVK